MKTTLIAGLTALLLAIPSQTFAAPSAAACKAAWDKADKNGDGSVTPEEAKEFFADIEKSGKVYDTNKDGKLSLDEFLKACQEGVFPSVQ
jgi:Ca2+-binding EF-hand superfamily protein